jgi:hypothetical protein
MGKGQNTLMLLAGMNGMRGLGVAISIGFSLEDAPQLTAGFFT